MPVKKKSTKARRTKPVAEANGISNPRPAWEVEMERTIDEMVAPLDGDVSASRANLRRMLQPSFEFADQYVVFKFHWESQGRGKRRLLAEDGVVFHAKTWAEVQKFLEPIPDKEQQFYSVHLMD